MTILKQVARYGCTLRVYDNGGKTFDRYTMIPPRWAHQYRERDYISFEAIGSSEDPFYPQGFGMHVSAVPGKHLGKRIHFNQLTPNAQKFARQSFPEFCPQNSGIYRQSEFAPEVSIVYHLPAPKCAAGWNLEVAGKTLSPLEAIEDAHTRQLVIDEANKIVWPHRSNGV